MKAKRHWFLWGIAIYAVLFLTVTGLGLKLLWDFLEAYEGSRPNNAVKAYMAQVDADYIVARSQELIDSIDHNLQSPQECREILGSSIGTIRHTKKSRECTDTRLVYMVQTGSQVLGSFTMEAGEPDKYGFTPWSLKEECYDLSYLLGQPLSVTVPDVCQVAVNGVVLDDSYITENHIPYTEIAEYYGEYELPCQVTYTAGPLLGEPEMTVTDGEGNGVTFDENTDWSLYYNNCTNQEQEELTRFVGSFLKHYVAFTGSNKYTRKDAHEALVPYILSGSDLAQRLKDAIEGLQFGQSRGDTIVSVHVRPLVRLGDRFLVDLTYEVDTLGQAGVVRTTTEAQLMIVKTGSTMKVESIQFR